MAAGQRSVERIGAVVETGMGELARRRFKNAGAQFSMASGLCAEADGGRRVDVLAMPETDGNDPRFSSSLELGLRVLACFTEEHPLWGIAELAAEVGRSRSTVHRYCVTLVKLGQITQEGIAARKYARVIADV